MGYDSPANPPSPPRLPPFAHLVFPFPLPSDQYQTFRRLRNAGYWLRGKKMGRGARKTGRQEQRNNTEPHGTPNGGHYDLKSTALSPLRHFALLVLALSLPSDQYRTFRRFRNAGRWFEGPVRDRRERKWVEKHNGPPRNPRGRQMDAATPQNPPPPPVFPLSIFSFPPFLFQPPNTESFGRFETMYIVCWGDKGLRRTENGKTSTTDHRGTPGPPRTTTEPRGTPNGGHYANTSTLFPPLAPSDLPVFSFRPIRQIPNVSAVSKLGEFPAREDKGAERTGNGKPISTDHHITPRNAR